MLMILMMMMTTMMMTRMRMMTVMTMTMMMMDRGVHKAVFFRDNAPRFQLKCEIVR